MAAPKKKKSTKAAPKKAAVKTGKGAAAPKPVRDPIRVELFAIGYIAVALILLLVFLFFDPLDQITGAGVIGVALAKFFALLFGKARFAVPALLLLLGWFYWKRRDPGFPFARSVIFAFVFFLSIVAFCGVFQELGSFGQALDGAAAEGGWIGNCLGWLLLKAFQRVISIVILSALALVSLVAMTGISFFGLLRKTGAAGRKAGRQLNDKAHERREERAAARAAAQEQEAAARRPRPMGKLPRIEEEFPRINLPAGFEEDEVVDKATGEVVTKVFPAPAIDEEPPLTDSDAPDPAYDLHFPSFGQHMAAAVEAAAPVIEGEDPDLGLTAGTRPEELAPSRRSARPRVTVMEELAVEPIPAPLVKIQLPDDSDDDVDFNEVAADAEAAAVAEEIGTELARPYELPKTSLLKKAAQANNKDVSRAINESVEILENTLTSFGVNARVTEVSYGPSITRFEVQPGPGVKVSKIVGLADDIALQLKSAGIRMEAPVPGKSVIGIEVPRQEMNAVSFRDMLESSKFFDMPSRLVCAFGKDIAGQPVLGDLAAMPHLLIAGATGSGKSVCMNTIICSLLFRAKPDEVKFIMIDPKRVEFAAYEGLPHLITPVVTDPKKAAGALKWALREMESRYALFNTNRVKNLEGYNALVTEEIDRLPQIVVFIDELSDLMMVAAKDVEECICRLAQMARAAGIHLVIATQRPSVDVITGLIKANIPSRIAFAVSSQIDSRTILDMGGAEKLLGKGDMLYHPVGMAKPLRVQGAFLSEEEAGMLIEHCKRQCDPDYVEGVAQPVSNDRDQGEIEDALFYEAAKAVITAGQASASSLQRRFRIGYNRAARLIEVLQERGIVGPADGARPRQILMTLDNFLINYPPPEDPSLFDE